MSLASRTRDLAVAVGAEISRRTSRHIGTTEQRRAAQPREGLRWFDTSLGFELEYVGGAWRAVHAITQSRSFTVSPTAAFKNQNVPLAVALDGGRPIVGTIAADAISSRSVMVVGTLERYTTGTVTSVNIRFASIPNDFGAATNILFNVTGYPLVEQ